MSTSAPAAEAARRTVALLSEAAGLGAHGFLDPARGLDEALGGVQSTKWPPSPHLSQLSRLPDSMPAGAIPLLLHPEAPTAVYRRRRDEAKSVVHWGQRKLFVSELTFLTLLGCSPTPADLVAAADVLANAARSAESAQPANADTVLTQYAAISRAISAVLALGPKESHLAPLGMCCPHRHYSAWLVYAGAAPGTHVPLLASLFPRVRFVLVDPAPFSVGGAPLPNIHVRQEFFTDCVAEALRREWEDAALSLGAACAPPLLLFASDVRTADWRIMTESQVETAVAKDMATQQRWVQILRPVAALLKFRLPWDETATPYLAGAVALPVWGPPTTSESRLIVPSPTLVEAVLLTKGAAATSGAIRRAGAIEIALVRRNRGAIPADAHAEANQTPLVPSFFPLVAWDNRVYTEQMFYFNTDTRLRAYAHKGCDAQRRSLTLLCKRPRASEAAAHQPHDELSVHSACATWGEKASEAGRGDHTEPGSVESTAGLDHCFDCSAELSAVRAWLMLVWRHIIVSQAATVDSAQVDSGACTGPGRPGFNGTQASIFRDSDVPCTLRALSECISTAISPATGRSLSTQLPPAALQRFPCHILDVESRTRLTLTQPHLEAAFREVHQKDCRKV